MFKLLSSNLRDSSTVSRKVITNVWNTFFLPASPSWKHNLSLQFIHCLDIPFGHSSFLSPGEFRAKSVDSPLTLSKYFEAKISVSVWWPETMSQRWNSIGNCLNANKFFYSLSNFEEWTKCRWNYYKTGSIYTQSRCVVLHLHSQQSLFIHYFLQRSDSKEQSFGAPSQISL